MRRVRVLIAPDSFKESLSGVEVCAAMRAGAERWGRERGVGVEIDACPVADGGEGTVAAVAGAHPSAEVLRSRVTGPLGEQVEAAWAKFEGEDGERTGVVETASCAGLMLVAKDRRDPTKTTTRGLGELIRIAAESGCTRVLVGLGSSATTDGGIGVGTALGWRFLDAQGAPIEPTGGGLLHLARVVPPITRIAARVVALCDVDNPLLGPAGTARVFARQKGATEAQIELLEKALERLVRCCVEAGIECDPSFPGAGAGAAGGLGFGLRTFAGAELARGAPTILDALGFDARAARADVVMTGEGRLDATSLRGKAVYEVARRAARCGKPTIALVGTTEGSTTVTMDRMATAGAPLAGIVRLIDLARNDADAIGRAGMLLEEATVRGLSAWFSRSAG